jgi:GT2 family glycosyltransferase
VRARHPGDAGPLAAVGPAVAASIGWGHSPVRVPAADDACWALEVRDLIGGGLANTALRALRSSEARPDPAVIGSLKEAATAETLRSLNVETRSAEALRRLEGAGVRPIVIKGPAVAAWYKHSTDRAFTDLDLLVDPHEFAMAKAILETSGFRVPFEGEQPWPFFDRLCREGVNLHGPTEANIDVHHHIPPWRYSRHLGYADIAGASSDLKLCGQVVQAASPAHSMVIAGLHLLSDLWKGGRTYRSWRDLLVLSHRIGPAATQAAFVAADLEWLMALLFDQLAIVSRQPPPVADGRRRSPLREARLHALGWGGGNIVARHRVGWGLRLPAAHMALFMAGSMVPSPSYIRSHWDTYGAYWQIVRRGLRETVEGADHRYAPKRFQKEDRKPLTPSQSETSGNQGATVPTHRIWVGLLRLDALGGAAEGPVREWDSSYDAARLLVVDGHGRTLRWIDVDGQDMDIASLDRVRTGLRSEASIGPFADERSPASISVAVCTRDRPDQLEACLARIVEATGDDYELVVVDSASTTSATEEVVEQLVAKGHAVRLVSEGRPGLSRARNAALAACHGDYVLFTDDDVLVDRNWLSATRRGLARAANVAVVTGLVPPAELEAGAQRQFDSKLAWSSRLAPDVFSMTDDRHHDFVFPYSAGHFGTGANMAVHRRMVLDAGGFNEQLGAGTRSHGGEDLEIFVRMLRGGGQLVYEPSSIAWHRHRGDDRALRAQIFGYGSGFSAYLTALMELPGRRDVLRAVLQGSRQLARSKSEEKAGGTTSDLLWRELSGMAWGPFAYGWERLASRPIRRERVG